MRRVLALVILIALLPCAGAAAEVEEPAGYRFDPYRAPTPAGLAGATTINTSAAERMWREGKTLFIDVLPREAKPANLPAGTVWRDRRRDNIPGSLWIPNVGYGALSEEMDAYFRRTLQEVTNGDPGRPLVFYCQADCWMSWNAAKRAIALGYSRVIWYPEGTDGWTKANLPLTEAQPRS